MLRVIFDTNIYGILIERKEERLIEKIRNDRSLKVLGYKPIKDELREIPKKEKLGTLSKRNLIINVYQEITKGKYLLHSTKIDHLAKKYYNRYKQKDGLRNWEYIGVDFTIIACASIHGLDIIVSEDKKTMRNKTAIASYDHINIKEGYRTPKLYGYKYLKTRYNV